jgi:hypothetical protein
MARTAIALQEIKSNAGASVAFAAADSVNGMQVQNDGQTILEVANAGVASTNVTVHSVPCSHGRTQDLVVAVAAGASGHLGPFSKDCWNQSGGLLTLDFSIGTSVTIAAISKL